MRLMSGSPNKYIHHTVQVKQVLFILFVNNHSFNFITNFLLYVNNAVNKID